MLELKDIFHLPQLDERVEQLAADGPGLIVVAGLDPQLSSASAPSGRFLPSGRSAVLRMLMQHLLTVHPEAQCIVVEAAQVELVQKERLERELELARRSLLLAEGRRERSPRAVLHSVNRLLLELGRPSMFVTVFYGVVDMAARQMTYARAGHDRPLLLRGETVEELAGEGTILGFLDDDELNLSEEQLALAPGDRLVLYTDGLTDILSPGGQPFGRGRLKALLQSHADLPSEELCGAVFTELLAYQGGSEQFDDMTMLVVEIQRHGGERA